MISEPPNELEALKESLELTVKTQTVSHVKITSNWVSEIQRRFDQHNSFMEEFSASIASFYIYFLY